MAVRATQVQLLLYKWGEKGSQALAGAAPGGEGVPIPAGVQGTTGHGTQSSGRSAKEGITRRLDLMVSELLSSLPDSGILREFPSLCVPPSAHRLVTNF